MEQTATQDAVEFRAELVRKGIHLFSLAIPIVYSFISKGLALAIVIPIAAAFIVVDLARYEIPQVSGPFYKFFGFILRKREIDKKKRALNGATFMLISAVICIVIFPKFIMVSGFTVLILADAASAVFGKRYGKHKINRKRDMPKSYEGSLAFIVAGAIAVALTPKVEYAIAEYVIGLIATVVASVAEVTSTDIIDDNIAIPISFGLTMWALYVIFLPHFNLFFMG